MTTKRAFNAFQQFHEKNRDVLYEIEQLYNKTGTRYQFDKLNNLIALTSQQLPSQYGNNFYIEELLHEWWQ